MTTFRENAKALAPPDKVQVRRMTGVLAQKGPPPFWHGRLYPGFISTIIGSEGAGKSTLSCYLAARLTQGLPLPDEADEDAVDIPIREPVDVGVIAFEDPMEKIWLPRFKAHGGDCDRLLDLSVAEDQVFDADAITNLRGKVDAGFILIDPLTEIMTNLRVSGKEPEEIHRAMMLMREAIKDTPVGFQLYHHTNRGKGSLRDRESLSYKIRQSSRTVCHFGVTKLGTRGLIHDKFNYTGKADTLEFALDKDPWTEQDGEVFDLARLTYLGVNNDIVDFDDAIPDTSYGDGSLLVLGHVKWVVDTLHKHGGDMARDELTARFLIDRGTKKTLQRALVECERKGVAWRSPNGLTVSLRKPTQQFTLQGV